jgi:hypothetical protein
MHEAVVYSGNLNWRNHFGADSGKIRTIPAATATDGTGRDAKLSGKFTDKLENFTNLPAKTTNRR